MFGCSSTICAKAWLLMIDGWDDKMLLATTYKFLWALHLLIRLTIPKATHQQISGRVVMRTHSGIERGARVS